jgi:hypothetical protein
MRLGEMKGTRFAWQWIKAGLSFRKLHFEALESDQKLLYTGSSVSLLWAVRGACVLKVFVNGEFTGSYLPAEVPRLQVQRHMHIIVEAAGPYGKDSVALRLSAKSLRYREANRPLPHPELIQPDILPVVNHIDTGIPQPLLSSDDINLSTEAANCALADLARRLAHPPGKPHTQKTLTQHGI